MRKFLLIFAAIAASAHAGTTYHVISSTHFCGHVGGGFPARCWRNDDANCETQCTAIESCIAYGVGNGHCVIIPSTGSCLSGWNFLEGHIAEQRSDLTTSTTEGYNCLAKASHCTFSNGQMTDCCHYEDKLGTTDTEMDCASLVISQRPAATGATWFDANRSCYAGFGNRVDPGSSTRWRACLFEPECDSNQDCPSSYNCIYAVCIEEIDYWKAGSGTNCPLSNVITTESKCRVAANALGLTYRSALYGDGYPAGCMGINNGDSVYFNPKTDIAPITVQRYSGICKVPIVYHEQLTPKHCDNVDYNSYNTVSEAKDACNLDSRCQAVYDGGCDESQNGVHLCPIDTIYTDSSSGSCIYEKECWDTNDGNTNNDGYGCDSYHVRYPGNCGDNSMDNNNFDSNHMCCACGGGVHDGLRNAGVNCWDRCSQNQGPCGFCGTGLCCRKGWEDTSNGCDGSLGIDGHHVCVHKGLWCAKLYEHGQFSGWRHEVAVTERDSMLGEKNDQVSSIKVREGCTFKGYHHRGLDDLMFSATGDIPSLSEENNDKMTSFSCECRV